MPNIFTKTGNTTENNSIPRIKPTEIEQDDLFDLIENFDHFTKESKNISSKLNKVKKDLKNIALDEYLGKYQEEGKNPGTIIIEAISSLDQLGEYMFVPSDRYTSIKTEDKADEIEEKYGEGIVKRELIHTFDPELLEKYQETISRLISECDEIEEEDKGKLIQASETYRIIEGTIDNFSEINPENIKELFEGLSPVVSLRSPKIIKS